MSDTAPGRRRVYVSAGSNIEPRTHLRSALGALREAFGALDVSSVYQTRAVGFDGDDFWNCVIAFDSAWPPAKIVAALNQVEAGAGRRRNAARFTARTLDLDLLMVGDLVTAADGITLPRDDILTYAFVLAPLAELAPGLRHPVADRTMAELWQCYDDADGTIIGTVSLD